MINANDVEKTFLYCLFTNEEVVDMEIPANAIVVDGITAKFAFHRDRLEESRPKVQAWLAELPDQFHSKRGGGWSFLNACDDRNGEQWTGMHQRMDQLFCLGLGLNLVLCLMPRDLWDVLPGGMPYYAVC